MKSKIKIVDYTNEHRPGIRNILKHIKSFFDGGILQEKASDEQSMRDRLSNAC